jgi:hypothetical protein
VALRNRVWIYVAGLAILMAAAVGGVIYLRGRYIPTAALLKRLPARDAVLLYIDFDALRRGGILQLLDSSRAGQDPDYQKFVSRTNFDYRRDLDAALVSFAPDGKYLLVRGRFDWKSLHDYVRDHGGSCVNAFCRMAGSVPERQISFFRLQKELMGMAVSRDDFAARRLEREPSGPEPAIPDDPVWLSVPASLFRSVESLPTGTRMFVRGMESAESVMLAFRPEGDRLAARLEVLCRDERDAAAIASQLSSTTVKLREAIEREKQTPNPADLSGVLTSGTFRTEGRRVIGHWPIDRRFVETILTGAE